MFSGNGKLICGKNTAHLATMYNIRNYIGLYEFCIDVENVTKDEMKYFTDISKHIRIVTFVTFNDNKYLLYASRIDASGNTMHIFFRGVNDGFFNSTFDCIPEKAICEAEITINKKDVASININL